MSGGGKKKSVKQARYSWTLLTLIPKRRLLPIARTLGYDALEELPPGRLAEYILEDRVESRRGSQRSPTTVQRCVLSELTLNELVTLARRIKIPVARRSRLHLIKALLQPSRDRLDLTAYTGYPERIEEDYDLRAWIVQYIREAEADGCVIDFGDDTGERPVESTIRLICDCWSYCGWPDWLMWQRYGGPRGRGPWLIADFSKPWRWRNATMALRNPWDFAFSEVFMASDPNDVTFELRTSKGERLSLSEHRWLAAAVLDGMKYDFDDEDFLVIAKRKSRSLIIQLCNPDSLEPGEYVPSKDGVVWT